MVGINKRGTSVLRLFDESRDDYRAFFLFLFFIMKCGFGVICCLPPGRLIIPCWIFVIHFELHCFLTAS